MTIIEWEKEESVAVIKMCNGANKQNLEFAEQMNACFDEILGNGPVVCGVDSSVMATRIAFAAIKSAAEGRIVKISEI